MFLPADSEESDQTGLTPRLIWVFAGRTGHLMVLSCGSSIIIWVQSGCQTRITVFDWAITVNGAIDTALNWLWQQPLLHIWQLIGSVDSTSREIGITLVYQHSTVPAWVVSPLGKLRHAGKQFSVMPCWSHYRGSDWLATPEDGK